MMDQTFLCLKDDKTMYFAVVSIRLEHVGQWYGGLHCAADQISSLSVESTTILKSC